MIKITTIPPATAVATSQSLALQMLEKIYPNCNPSTLNADVSYKVGPVSVADGVAMANVTATITLSYQTCSCRYARQSIYQETFLVAFESTTNNTIEVVGSSVNVSATEYKCCKPHAASINTSVAVSIS